VDGNVEAAEVRSRVEGAEVQRHVPRQERQTRLLARTRGAFAAGRLVRDDEPARALPFGRRRGDVSAARAQCGEAIDQAVIDTGGFRFGKVLDLHDPNFLPGGAKYGDLPALLALGAPGRAWVGGETAEGLALARSQYKAVNAETNFTPFSGEAQQVRAAAIEWLLAASEK
jgi:hypothetical protein